MSLKPDIVPRDGGNFILRDDPNSLSRYGKILWEGDSFLNLIPDSRALLSGKEFQEALNQTISVLNEVMIQASNTGHWINYLLIQANVSLMSVRAALVMTRCIRHSLHQIQEGFLSPDSERFLRALQGIRALAAMFESEAKRQTEKASA